MKMWIVPALVLAAFALNAQAPQQNTLRFSSPDFREGENIPARFTCDGLDGNPALRISGVPPGTKSLALIMDDPDAPSGTFTHWLFWGLSPQFRKIPERSMLDYAVQGTNGFGNKRYNGPCPPSGVHRYYLRLYALDIRPGLPSGASRKALEEAMAGHVIAEAALMGRYARHH